MKDTRTLSIPARIALVYIIAGLIYIYFSDSLVDALIANLTVASFLQTVKGSGFVLVTGTLLYLLIRRYVNSTEQYYTQLVAEKKRSIDEIKRSEEKYWAVFNYNPLPMWIYDTDTLRFLLVNDAACKKYGYSPDEFYTMTIADIRPGREITRLQSSLNVALNTKHKTWNDPYIHLTKSGQELFVIIESTQIEYDGRQARLIMATDISERIKNEKALLLANTRLANASKIANLGYWTNNLKTGEIYWSDTMYDIFELDKRSFSLRYEDIMKQMLGEKENICFYPAQEAGEPDIQESERQVITGKGNRRWIAERVNRVRDSTGKSVFLEGSVLDITAKKLADQALQVSHERFKMVAKAAVEAIIDWDLQTGEMFWGDGFYELFGYEPAHKSRFLWIRNIHPDDRVDVNTRLKKAIADKNVSVFTDEFRFLKSNRDIAYVQHRSVFVRNDEGVAIRVVGAMIDVTQNREKVAHIERQNQELREIAWLQSHIVRAPVANILGLADLLKHTGGLSADASWILDDLQGNATRLDNIVREIVLKTELFNISDKQP